MRGSSIPNQKSTKAAKVARSTKLKSPQPGRAAKISKFHASRGKTVPRLTKPIFGK